MKVLLLNVWFEQNKGDLAIVKATIQLLKDKYGVKDEDISISFLGVDQKDLIALKKDGLLYELKNYKLYPGFIKYLQYKNHQIYSINPLKTLINICVATIQLIFGKHPLGQIIKESDLLISKGGSYIYSFYPKNPIKELLLMYVVMYPLLIASRFKKHVILFGNTIGDIYSQLSIKFIKYALKPHVIVARDKHTQEYLKKFLHKDSLLAPDIAFYLSDSAETKYRPINSNSINIGITVRDWTFHNITDPKKQNQVKKTYENSFVQLIQAIIKKYPKSHITFYPQVAIPSKLEDDRHIMHRIEQKLPQELIQNVTFVYKQPLLQDLIKQYHKQDIIIGTRMHSIILSIPTPFIPIAYMGKKTYGLIELLQYPKNLLINIDNINYRKILKHLDFIIRNHKKLFEHLLTKKKQFQKQLYQIDLLSLDNNK